MIKNENYITIQGFMVNELGLKGNELTCYAIIYGFSQGEQYANISYTYISEWLGLTKRSVVNLVNKLIDKGLVEKALIDNNDVRLKAILEVENKENRSEKISQGGEKSSYPGVKKVHRGGEKISHPILYNNNKNNNNNISKEKNTKKESLKTIIEEYTSDTDLQNDLLDFVDMRKNMKQPFTDRALKMILKRLDTLTGNKRDIIQQSIMNGWKNVYDCKSSDVSNEPTWYQDKEVKQADDDLIAQALELQRRRKA